MAERAQSGHCRDDSDDDEPPLGRRALSVHVAAVAPVPDQSSAEGAKTVDEEAALGANDDSERYSEDGAVGGGPGAVVAAGDPDDETGCDVAAPLADSVAVDGSAANTIDNNNDAGIVDLDDGSDVVYLFEQPSTAADADQAEPGPCDGSQVSEDSDGCANHDEVNPLQYLREALVGDNSERWVATSRFFCHDKTRTAHDQGVQLYGTTLTLRPHQMEAVYALLERCFVGGLDGGIVALDTGLGKTIIALAAVATMRLVELNYVDVKREWGQAVQHTGAAGHRQHNDQGMEGPCPSANPWGIECCCVVGSLSSHIACRLGPGPSLVFTPPGVAGQFAREAARYLKQQVEQSGPNNAQHNLRQLPFVDVIDLSTARRLTPAVRNDILTDFVGAYPVYKAPKKGHNKKAEPSLVSGSGSKMGYTPTQALRLSSTHRLVVVSSSPGSLSSKGRDSSCFARVYHIQQEQRKSRRPYVASWAVAPRFIVLDEFHRVKDDTTTIYKTLQQIRSQASPGNSFKLAALSATPISVSVQQSLKAVLSLIVPPDRLETFCLAAQTVDLAAKSGLPKDMDRYHDAIEVCCDMLARVTTLRTTTDLFYGKVLLPLPALHADRIPCKSARAREDDFRHKMDQLTVTWRQAAYEKLKKQSAASDTVLQDRFFQLARFNSSFTLMLWLASFPGIVDLPDELSSDPGAWLNRSTMDDAVTTREGRAAHVGRHVETIVSGSGKMEQLQRRLELARKDVSLSDRGGGNRSTLKKHACVFTSRPGMALIIAAYADKHWSAQWEVVMVLSAATPAGKKAIDRAFCDIPSDSLEKPTLFIATVGTCGTGLDSLQKANHGILFDLPFVEADVKQACGRIWRSGQRFPCYWAELWADDSEAEVLINERHKKRIKAFMQVLGRGSSNCDNGVGGGSG